MPEGSAAAAVGQCFTCRWMRSTTTRRGSTFFRCARADTDARFARYPTLPMQGCPGYEVAMLFVVLMHYTQPLDAVDAVRVEHVRHLEAYAARGLIHAWARREPPTGGLFIATAPDRVGGGTLGHWARIPRRRLLGQAAAARTMAFRPPDSPS